MESRVRKMKEPASFKEVIDIITSLEREFDVNSLYYKNLRMWPYIRLKLWYQLHPFQNKGLNWQSKLTFYKDSENGGYCFGPRTTDGVRPTANPDNNTKVSFVKRCEQNLDHYLKNLFTYREQKRQLSANCPAEVLFYSKSVHSFHKVGGKFYNVYLDPLIELALDTRSCLKVEVRNSFSKGEHEYRYPPVFIELSRNVDWRKRGALTIKEFPGFCKKALEIYPGLSLDGRQLAVEAEMLLNVKVYFTKLLKWVKPRAVFFVTFPSMDCLALALAAGKMGIPTVDMQHGYIPDHIGLYTHWTSIPGGGYDILPDFFWCWNDETKKRICSGRPAGSTEHLAIVGGNPWLGKWLSNPRFGELPPGDYLVKKLNGKQKIILLNVQHLKEFLPVHVIEVMRESPPGWLWLVRLHPFFRGYTQQVKDLLEKDNIFNFEIERATHYPLYSLLRYSHYHIAVVSTVSFEALSFGVPTIFVDHRALQVRQNELQRGIFSYAGDSQSLMDALTRPPAKVAGLIETDEKITAQAFAAIVDGQR